MSLKILTAEFMISDSRGTGVSSTWLPRIVDEQFLQSTKDGDIKISPDPVTMIDGDLTWYNTYSDPQRIWVWVHRAPRSIVAQSPATVVIHDAWSHRVAVQPVADYPSVVADTFGGRLQIDRSSVGPDDLRYCRFFFDADDSQSYVDVGVVPPGQGFHFRYLAAVQTPNIWTEPTQFTARWEASANWTRLVALALPETA